LEVLSLKLRNFRNFTELELVFEPEGALIHGNNGIGKTNLLEAISYFAFGKSFRTSSDLDLINFSKAFFRIEGSFKLKNTIHKFEAAVDKTRKLIKIDGNAIARISELYRYLKVVYFSPDDIFMIGGSPKYRRNFIDQAISQYSFKYIEFLRTYNRILKQRNALLKTKFESSEKRTWDEQFARNGAELIKLRLKYLEQFIPKLTKCYDNINENSEILGIEYKYSFPVTGTDIADDILRHLNETEEQEIKQERTLCGPHLDDIDFLIDQHAARKFGSQGQKRSLAIAVRLVQAQLILEEGSEAPIFMFDDVLADLDKKRAKKIMGMLKKSHQVFIATPNTEIYAPFNLPEIEMEKLSETE
jgi:DNA replication and repair protein RecF